jgi:hypothetical protein
MGDNIMPTSCTITGPERAINFLIYFVTPAGFGASLVLFSSFFIFSTPLDLSKKIITKHLSRAIYPFATAPCYQPISRTHPNPNPKW